MTAPHPSTTDDLILVLEQTLGNAVHGRNLERVLAQQPAVAARVVRLDHDDASWRRRWPVVGNWTLEASVRARRQVLRLHGERPADALYVHSAVCATLLGDVMRRVPTVLSTDATPRNLDTVATGYGHAVRSPRVEQVKQRITGSVYRGARAVVAQSAWAAASLVDDYGVAPERVHVVPQGADLRGFYDPATRERRGERLRLLFVGRDFARKGGPVLLEAVRRLEGLVELDVVTGAEPADLPAHVRVHRDLPHGSPELLRLFHDADAFVLPTLSDAAPLVLGEALAAGLPVVATDVGAVPEMAVHGTTGLLVPAGQVDALVAAVRTLAEQEELRRSMGERARELAVERYDVQRNSERVLAVLHDVARSGAGERS